jgi:hypothetical protein
MHHLPSSNKHSPLTQRMLPKESRRNGVMRVFCGKNRSIFKERILEPFPSPPPLDYALRHREFIKAGLPR